MNSRPYTDKQRAAIAHAWQVGGSLSLGLLLSKVRSHFAASDYAEAVRVAREELNDQTDYSKDQADDS